jgi:citrate lyase subunit beta / citryl-CoA lyase
MPAVTRRPRRSCLYMPGGNARALEKAQTLPADTLIFDLEDAVLPDAKDAARSAVAAIVSARGYGKREIIVRINSLDTDWAAQDIAAIVAARPDGILLPKVKSSDDIIQANNALTAAGADEALVLWAMIEMPAAILNIADIASISATTRLCGFVMGTNDLGKELRAVSTPDRAAFQTALSLTIVASRSFGLAAIDSVHNDYQDTAGLEAECRQGRILGFDGKSLIHPAQLDAANRIFAPDPGEVEAAKAIIAAFGEPENQGKGVITVNGKMTELLHLEQAEQLLAMQQAIDG